MKRRHVALRLDSVFKLGIIIALTSLSEGFLHRSRTYQDAKRFCSGTPIHSRPPPPPKRRRVNRRPRYYWSDLSNLQKELQLFWDEFGVNTGVPPTIPNEVLLSFYRRHDLRGAIASHGGRESVSDRLGGAPIMPGRWVEAAQESTELQQLIALDEQLSAQRPPGLDGGLPAPTSSSRWSHQSSRKPKGYWTIKVVIQELYEYVDEHRETHNRPSVWMPRASELTSNGRDDLRQALNRFGGVDKICRQAGMVPYQEWNYFEGQLDLLLELKRYCDVHLLSDDSDFPSVTEIRKNDSFERLYSLIQFYGGRKFLALRLGMVSANAIQNSNLELNWGPFDLEFAIELLVFVRQDQLSKYPPLQHRAIGMPSQTKLLTKAEKGSWLHEKISEFGGYENVARRLGLAV